MVPDSGCDATGRVAYVGRAPAAGSANLTQSWPTGALSDSVGQAGPSGRPGRTGSCRDRPISPPAGPIAGPGLRGQGLPAGNGPGTSASLRVVGDGWEQPAQLDRGRELATLLVDGANRGGLSLGDDEHAGRMGVRTEGGKLGIIRH